MTLVQQHHIDAARQAGACVEQRDKYSVGTPLDRVSMKDLLWIERNLPDMASEVMREENSSAPLSLYGPNGWGSGHGYGHDYGHAYHDAYTHADRAHVDAYDHTDTHPDPDAICSDDRQPGPASIWTGNDL